MPTPTTHRRIPPPLDTAQGERLSRDAYRADFRQTEAQSRDQDVFKLERGQHFEESENASREALRRGDWDQALRIIDQRRQLYLATVHADALRSSVFHRVRIVEEPLTPYVQWELHALRLQDECGMPVSILRAHELRDAEDHGPLPELVVLGTQVMYEVLYTTAGAPDGAIRHTHTVDPWAAYLRDLHASGENIQTYFNRRVAPLPPPQPA